MLSNVNSLFLAWAVSLIIVVGGVLGLEALHTPQASAPEIPAGTEASPDIPTETTDNNQPGNLGNTAQDTSAPLSQQSATNQTGNEIQGLPAPGEQVNQTPTAQSVRIERTLTDLQAVALPELLEKTPQGMLPKISDDGRKSYQVYAAPAPLTNAPARLALMITDLGLKSRITQNALAELPGDIALAFSPYSRDLNNWGERARRDGHEVFLSIPMEPVNYPQNDPGSLTLLTSYSQRESLNILRQSLVRMTGYVGVLNHMGSRFTAASDSLRPILDEINSRGLMFVDSRTTPYSRAATMSKAIGLPVALNNGYIDRDLSTEQIAAELKKLEQRALTQGAAMGMARPYPVSIRAIKVWAATLEERGFVLVPVTAIANMQALPR